MQLGRASVAISPDTKATRTCPPPRSTCLWSSRTGAGRWAGGATGLQVTSGAPGDCQADEAALAPQEAGAFGHTVVTDCPGRTWTGPDTNGVPAGKAAAQQPCTGLIGVPWDQTSRNHHWALSLVTADGHAVEVDTPVGPQAVVLEGDFEVGRPHGVPSGMEIQLPIAVNFGPLPLLPSSQFEWRLEIDGTSNEQWRLSFFTPAPGLQMPTAPGSPA